jgi:hypothetical protein
MDYLKQRSESLSSHPARSWLLEEGARTNQPDDATAGPAASRRGEGPGPAGAAATAAAKRGARAIFSGGATGSRLGARERKREGRGGFVPGQGVGRSGGKPKLFRPGLAPKRATVEEDRPLAYPRDEPCGVIGARIAFHDARTPGLAVTRDVWDVVALLAGSP